MPFTYEFSPDARALWCAGSGVVTAAEVADVLRTWLAHPEQFRRVGLCEVLIDRSADVRLSAADLRDLARLDAELAAPAPGLAVAVIAPEDHAFGVSRMWEDYVAGLGWATRVFRRRAEAQAWLSAGPPREPPTSREAVPCPI